MKKVLFTIVILLSLSFVFTSCEKEEDYTSPTMTTATISGVVWAELDYTNTTTEKAPSGTKIYAKTNAANLVTNPIAGYAYEDVIFETTVGTDGAFSFTVSAGDPATTYTIYGDDFEYDVVITGTTTQSMYFTMTGGATVTKGQKVLVDLMYN